VQKFIANLKYVFFMTTKSKVILGLVGAAAAGVLVGVLIAPDNGKEIRRNLGKTAGDWADHLTDLFANAKGELSNLGKKASKGASNVSESYM
jgi:gas vesicle protein